MQPWVCAEPPWFSVVLLLLRGEPRPLPSQPHLAKRAQHQETKIKSPGPEGSKLEWNKLECGRSCVLSGLGLPHERVWTLLKGTWMGEVTAERIQSGQEGFWGFCFKRCNSPRKGSDACSVIN